MEIIHNNECDVLFATEKGYGKRVQTGKFRLAHRGGVGVRTIPTGARNGVMIGLAKISDNSHVLLIDITGKIIRLDPAEIRTMGRHAQGVRLIRLNKDQKLIGVVSFDDEEIEEDGSVAPAEGAPGGVSEKLEGEGGITKAEAVEVGQPEDLEPEVEELPQQSDDEDELEEDLESEVELEDEDKNSKIEDL